MATTDRFLLDLDHAYQELCSVRLDPDYYGQLRAVFRDMYARKPADSVEAYDLALRVCIEALVRFVSLMHPYCGAQPDGHLFRLEDRLGAIARGIQADPGADPWKALADPFLRHADALEALGVLNRGGPTGDLFQRLLPTGSAKIPFSLPLEKRYGAHYIIAPSGLGKTTLLTAMVLEDIERVLRDEVSIVIMDPKGELTDNIKRIAIFAKNDRLVLIEPEDRIAINPFDLDAGSLQRSVDEIDYLFSSFAEQLTQKQSTLLRPTIRALLTGYPSPTLDVLHRLLAPTGLRLDRGGQLIGEFADFAASHPDPDLRNFLTQEFVSGGYGDTKDQVVRRLRSLREDPTIKEWFTCTKTRFNIRAAIDEHKVIVINNSRDILSDDGAEFFGRFFIAQIKAAGERRKTGDPRNVPTLVYVDECDQVIKTDHNIEDYVDKLRSKNIGIILAHQRLSHFSGNTQTLDALLNAPIRFANVDDDAKALADRLRVAEPEQLRLERGSFAAYVRFGHPQTAVIRVEKPDLAFMTAAEQQAIRVRMRERYGQPPGAPPQPAPFVPQPPRPQVTPAAPPLRAAPPPPRPAPQPPPQKKNVDWTQRISPKMALHGGLVKLKVTGLDGTNKVDLDWPVPPNSKDGDVLVIPGYGPFYAKDLRGDIHLKLMVAQPVKQQPVPKLPQSPQSPSAKKPLKDF